MRTPIPACIAVLAALGAAGCDTLGNPIDALRAKRGGPDEFQVLARDELTMPPSIRPSTLPTPRPGTPSPLEPDPRREAVAALAAETGLGASGERSAISRGESELLAAADATATSPETDAELARRSERLDAARPYEAPTLLELLEGRDPSVSAETIDPDSEARRLAAEGARAPVNPDAGPRPPLPGLGEEPEFFYDTARQGTAPRNTFTNTGTTPPPVPDPEPEVREDRAEAPLDETTVPTDPEIPGRPLESLSGESLSDGGLGSGF